MMPRYLTPIAAGIAALAVVITLILVITSPWSATDSEGSATFQGDVDCDQDVDAVDALFDLKWVAAIQPFGGCTEEAGDTDCNGEIEALDGLHILRYLAALPSLVGGDCTPIGGPLNGTPTPGATPTATPTPSTTAAGSSTPGPTATPTPTATATPQNSACSGPSSATSGGSGSGYTLTQVIPAATQPSMIDFTVIPGTGGREAVVITQTGYLYRVCIDGDGAILAFGNINPLVNCCGEQGLLSLAFSPDYMTDHFLYLYYTRSNGSGICDDQDGQCSFIARFTVTNNSIAGQPDNIVLRVIQPASNHNGGKLLFGDENPTPYLYLSLGDGGAGADSNGQNKSTMVGSIIRIDVSSGGAGYDIPPDNPFVGTDGADEIWAWGFRNPWRTSFDRDTGDLWVGDVGQGDWEEVDLIAKGENYGWRCYEGNDPYNLSGCGAMSEYEFPEAVYLNESPDCAIVGGYVYRGDAMPELDGWYIFSDNCSGRIRGFDTAVGGPPEILYDSPYAVSSLAELPNGELLVLTFNNAIFQLVSD